MAAVSSEVRMAAEDKSQDHVADLADDIEDLGVKGGGREATRRQEMTVAWIGGLRWGCRGVT